MRLADVTPSLTNFILQNEACLPKIISQVILFGSFAKNTARVGSDIDIALVSQESWTFEDRSTVREIFEEFECGSELSFFFTTENNLLSDDKNNANYWIRNEGVSLWNRN
jgi:predicted nucleotidyltransferase